MIIYDPDTFIPMKLNARTGKYEKHIITGTDTLPNSNIISTISSSSTGTIQYNQTTNRISTDTFILTPEDVERNATIIGNIKDYVNVCKSSIPSYTDKYFMHATDNYKSGLERAEPLIDELDKNTLPYQSLLKYYKYYNYIKNEYGHSVKKLVVTANDINDPSHNVIYMLLVFDKDISFNVVDQVIKGTVNRLHFNSVRPYRSGNSMDNFIDDNKEMLSNYVITSIGFDL